MKTRMLSALLALTLGAVPLTGCYEATIHLADGGRVRSPIVDRAFHFSLIDVIELSSHVDLAAACPAAGPTVIEEKLSVAGGVVNLIFGAFLPIFSVMNTSVDCAGGGGPPGMQSLR